MQKLTTPSGSTVVVIDDNCGLSKFYAVADALSTELQVDFTNKIDEAETLSWDFSFKQVTLSLHFNIFHGVSIFPQNIKNRKEENRVKTVFEEVFLYLQKKAY